MWSSDSTLSTDYTGPVIAASLHELGKSSPAKYGGYGFTFVELFVGSMMMMTALGGVLLVFLRKQRR